MTPITYTPQRDFTTHDAGECSAFGPFQCDGLVLSHRIPGFVTRDKDRSLHLIYRSASQRGRTIMPFRMFIFRHQSAPDTVRVSTRLGGVTQPDKTVYLGSGSSTGTVGVGPLQQDGDEARLIAAELAAPAAGDSIRNVSVVFRGIHGLGVLEDQVSQDVVSLTLLDTTQTRFGAGWQLAEFHRLVLGQSIAGQPAAIWALPDGSFTLFRKVGVVWTSPKGETSVLYDSTLAGAGVLSARWVIRLDNGASIGFRADGQQQFTEDLTGNRTQFVYLSPGSANARLHRIVDPSGMRFEMEYGDATNGPGMITDVWVKNAAGTSIGKVATFKYTKPGGYTPRLRAAYIYKDGSNADSTLFTYDTTLVYGAFVKSITDPRSTASSPIVTSIHWDALLWRPLAIQEPSRKPGMAGLWTFNRDPWRRIAPRVGKGRGNQDGDRLLYDVQMIGTHVSAGGVATDIKVDRFGHPTNVRVVAPEGIYTGGFLWKTFSGDDVRRITRDSLGRVLKIVRAPDSASIADSVMYRYDQYNRVDRVIRTTLQWPIKNSITLDTLSFIYDSITSFGAGKKCSRLLKSVGVMGTANGDTTKVVYGTSGVAQCLPSRMIGNAQDTTIFTYGPLTPGDPAAARPISVRDPNGDVSNVTYESTWWNSRLSYRGGINDTTLAWYNAWGRPDSIVDAVGKSTQYAYDFMGRVTHQRTGTGPLAPITRTDYAPGGLVTRVSIYSNSGLVTAAAVGDSQVTRNYHDGTGAFDSIASPGLRSGATKVGRLQSWKLRDNWGTPTWELPGNGTYINRLSDWRGRPKVTYQSPTNTIWSADGEPFADAATKTFYQNLDLRTGKQLSGGTRLSYEYDNKGNLKYSDSYDFYLGAYTTRHRMGYSPVGQLLADTLEFTDSLRVIRRFEYNRRGQRTQVADTVRRMPSGTILPEGTGLTVYGYSDTTGRMGATYSVLLGSGAPYIAWIGQYYDRGGRLIHRNIYHGNGADWSTGRVSTSWNYGTGGRLAAILTENGGTIPARTWYGFGNPLYSKIDELSSHGYTVNNSLRTQSLEYSGDGTRRLLQSQRSEGGLYWNDTYKYDAFGNRVRTDYATSDAGAGIKLDGNTCAVGDTLLYAADNRLIKQRKIIGGAPCRVYTYFNDQSGNRLAQLDSLNGSQQLVVNRMSYTAGNQLYYSLTKTSDPWHYDANWHWYDASGLRAISQGAIVTTWNPDDEPLTTGSQSFYVYDGSDVAMTITRTAVDGWSVRQRFMTGGIDNQLVVRSMNKNLILVSDRGGSTVAAVNLQGSAEPQTVYWSRDPFGAVDQGTAAGAISTETGFTGASSPSPSGGGFTYLRNRWYDAQTGRFLTQDPIGLAGGVNLYAYAGNNPIAFSDPFGLDPCQLQIPYRGRDCSVASLTIKLNLIPQAKQSGHKGPLEFSYGPVLKGTATIDVASNGTSVSGGLDGSYEVGLHLGPAAVKASCGAGTDGSYGCGAKGEVEAGDVTVGYGVGRERGFSTEAKLVEVSDAKVSLWNLFVSAADKLGLMPILEGVTRIVAPDAPTQ